ncbi:FAR1-related sequence 5-like protein [Tanacetum coccineum]|uniref:FAR1-related sequence 5-like protein n=1 Tax=Tanacetum coccineum TaxID=301880 RepID=A0ABQ5EKX2_9ASTR
MTSRNIISRNGCHQQKRISLTAETTLSHSLCGLFWADKVARLNYQRFGDTISFDATFRSNKYRMVFVPFTGIDNHNRSVTFGAGLLSDETVKSYKWLLQSFKKAFVADPQVVVTDQDASMKQAVEAEFPNARHRLLVHQYATKENFKERFCRIVWNERISIDMFEQEWAPIMDEFDLGSHKWSESENQYFNRFTNPDLTLVEFIGHFESATDIQRLLCHHILYVLRMNNVKEFPREYVLDRWSKSDDNLLVDTSAVAYESSSAAGIRVIRRIFEDTVDRLVPFKDKLDLYRLELSDLLAKAEEADVPVLMRVNKKDTFCSMLGVTDPERVVIKVPRHSKNKGTGSHTRWKNMDELIQNESESSKKRRTCFACGKAEGHNSITWPYKYAINAANKRTKRSTRSSDVNYKE